MYFVFLKQTYSQIIKEPYGFRIQVFKVLFSEVREPNDKFSSLYEWSWDTKTTLQVSVGFSFLDLLTRRCIGENYGGKKLCRIPSNPGLKWYFRKTEPLLASLHHNKPIYAYYFSIWKCLTLTGVSIEIQNIICKKTTKWYH